MCIEKILYEIIDCFQISAHGAIIISSIVVLINYCLLLKERERKRKKEEERGRKRKKGRGSNKDG